MGVTNVLYPFGFKYEDPKKPYVMTGFVTRPASVKGLEFYKSIYKCCTRPGLPMLTCRKAGCFQIGAGGDDDELVRLLPGLYKDPNVGRRQDRFFSSIRRKAVKVYNSAARAFRSSRPHPTATRRCKYIKWFATTDVQKKWWSLVVIRA